MYHDESSPHLVCRVEASAVGPAGPRPNKDAVRPRPRLWSVRGHGLPSIVPSVPGCGPSEATGLPSPRQSSEPACVKPRFFGDSSNPDFRFFAINPAQRRSQKPIILRVLKNQPSRYRGPFVSSIGKLSFPGPFRFLGPGLLTTVIGSSEPFSVASWSL